MRNGVVVGYVAMGYSSMNQETNEVKEPTHCNLLLFLEIHDLVLKQSAVVTERVVLIVNWELIIQKLVTKSLAEIVVVTLTEDCVDVVISERIFLLIEI